MSNKKEELISSSLKPVLLLLFSIGFIYYAFLTIETKWNKFFTVNIPLSSKFPIPILFWLGVFIYLIIISLFLKYNFRNLAWSGIILGFFTHFIFLLLNLFIRNANGEIAWASNLYLLYFRIILFLALFILSIWSGVLFRFPFSIKNRSIYPSFVYSIPLLFIYSGIVILTHYDYVLLLHMIASFLISFYLRGREGAYIKVKKIFNSFFAVIFNERIFLSIIFIASMGFKIVFLKRALTNLKYIYTSSDGFWMDRNARNFLAGKPVGLPQAKAYWIFLAGLYYLLGRDYFKVCIIQSLYGTLAVIMVYMIAKKVFGVVTARVAAIMATLDYSLIFAAGGLGHQAMDIFYSVLIVYLLMRYKDMGINVKSILLLIFIGFISGLTAMNREVNVFLPIVISGWLIWIFLKSGYKKIKAFGIIFLFLLSVVVSVMPFLYLNYLDSGSLYDQTSTYGIKKTFARSNPQLKNFGFDPFNDLSGSIKIVIQHPLAFLKVSWLNYLPKFLRLFFDQDYGSFDPIFLVRKPTTLYFLSMWFYAYLITFIGFVFAFLKRRENDKVLFFLILLIILYKTSFHLFTYAVYRYRTAIEPFLIIFTAYGVYVFIQFIRNKTKLLSSNV